MGLKIKDIVISKCYYVNLLDKLIRKYRFKQILQICTACIKSNEKIKFISLDAPGLTSGLLQKITTNLLNTKNKTSFNEISGIYKVGCRLRSKVCGVNGKIYQKSYK